MSCADRCPHQRRSVVPRTAATEPRTAEKIARFHEGDGKPATISYDVPLPGHQTGRRFVRLNLGLSANDFTKAATDAGEDIAKLISLQKIEGSRTFTFDHVAAAELFRRKLYESGATAAELAALDEAITRLREAAAEGSISSAKDARQLLTSITRDQLVARAVLF